jgi:hypothetical protein
MFSLPNAGGNAIALEKLRRQVTDGRGLDG